MQIFKYEITDSTNTRAKEYAKSKECRMPAVFIADGQTSGRGRRGRNFDSATGKGLYITLLYQPVKSNTVFLTIRAAVAMSRALYRACGVTVGIKWVNDLFLNGKKLAGILAEGEFDSDSGELLYAIVGVGVNLDARDFPSEIESIATSIEDEIGEKISRDKLAELFVSEFFSEISDAELLEEYRRLSTVLNKRITVRRLSGEVFTATALDITDTGALLVEHNGAVEELISAEVSINENNNNI